MYYKNIYNRKYIEIKIKIKRYFRIIKLNIKYPLLKLDSRIFFFRLRQNQGEIERREEYSYLFLNCLE